MSTAQAVIEAAKPLATTPELKKIINAAIAAYDVAEAGYEAYHKAATAGTATTVQQSTLQTQVVSLNTATTALTTAIPQAAKAKP